MKTILGIVNQQKNTTSNPFPIQLKQELSSFWPGERELRIELKRLSPLSM